MTAIPRFPPRARARWGYEWGYMRCSDAQSLRRNNHLRPEFESWPRNRIGFARLTDRYRSVRQ